MTNPLEGGGVGSLLLTDTVGTLLGVHPGAVPGLGLLSGLLSGDKDGVGTDSLVGLLVDGLDVVGTNTGGNVLGKMLLVLLLILLLEVAHVVGDVTTVNVLTEDLGIKLLGLGIITGEAGLGVGDVDTTIRGALHGGEDTGTSGGALETDIKEALEGTGSILKGLDHLDGAIGLLDTGVLILEAELGKDTAGQEKTSGVSSGPVGETVLDAELGELVSVGSGKNVITLELGVHDLADDVRVGEADDHAVLGGVVLVLGLDDQLLTGIVVSLTL